MQISKSAKIQIMALGLIITLLFVFHYFNQEAESSSNNKGTKEQEVPKEKRRESLRSRTLAEIEENFLQIAIAEMEYKKEEGSFLPTKEFPGHEVSSTPYYWDQVNEWANSGFDFLGWSPDHDHLLASYLVKVSQRSLIVYSRSDSNNDGCEEVFTYSSRVTTGDTKRFLNERGKIEEVSKIPLVEDPADHPKGFESGTMFSVKNGTLKDENGNSFIFSEFHCRNKRQENPTPQMAWEP